MVRHPVFAGKTGQDRSSMEDVMKEIMKKLYHHFCGKTHMVRRFILCFIAVCIMGFCVYWLDRLAWGTDPCSVMNLAIANRIGLSLGTTQAIINSCLFILVLLKDRTQIGFGTFLNMFMVGYSYNLMDLLMTWLDVDYHFPKLDMSNGFDLAQFPWGDFFWNLGACIILLVVFVIVAGIYMSVDLGSAPYDALSVIVTNVQKKLPFRIVRIIYDSVFAIGGYLLGGTIGVVTVVMALTLGPVISMVGKRIKRFL